jgi:hypothetical protein
MPIEATWLEKAPVPLGKCPHCESVPFRPFMRGQVQRSMWEWWNIWGKSRAYCALICADCKQIVGYEHPGFPDRGDRR